MKRQILSIVAVAVAMSTAVSFVMAGHHEHDDAYGDKKKSEEMASKNIVEIAAGNDQFSTLVTAVKEAGLAETLSGDGPFTVFAPTNEAFAALPDGTLEALLEPENRDQLVAILTYHVVPGKVMAKDVVELDSAQTVQGSELNIETHDGAVMINEAQVTKADIKASNGVIHVIDEVLLPPTE